VKFFRKLAAIDCPEDADIICGGDFNCVLNGAVDRSGGRRERDMGSRELLLFLEKAGLVDPAESLQPQVASTQALRRFAAAHHTHFHTSASGTRGSSRIDRFYVGAAANKYVRGVQTEEPLCKTDHRAVLLELHSPKGPIQIKKRPKLYPPAAYVQEATTSLIQQSIHSLRAQGNANEEGGIIAAWQDFKPGLKSQMRAWAKAARERMTNGYRQKITRLKASLMKCQLEGGDSSLRAQLLEAMQRVQDCEEGTEAQSGGGKQ
jgi:hypothetical protein